MGPLFANLYFFLVLQKAHINYQGLVPAAALCSVLREPRGEEIPIWVMEFAARSEEARGEVEDGQMLTFELEAAEALAGLSRCSAVRGEGERRPTQQILAESQVFFRFIEFCA